MSQQSETVLFFSRGKGRGHAVPDAAIADELMKLRPGVEITFVSYDVGAATLTNLGRDVIDMVLPEDPQLWDSVIRLIHLLRDLTPTLVVSHEEFAVAPLAKAFGLPVVFITDWFADPAWSTMQALRYADEVIFLDDAGYWDVPPYLNGTVQYVGPVLRRLEKIDPAVARQGLNIGREATVVMVAPGGSTMHGATRAPIFDLVVSAFDLLDVTNKKLIFIAPESDYSNYVARAAGRDDILVLRPGPGDAFTATLLASDVLITTGNRTPILEAHALGIPSISISSGHNPIDDQRNCRVPTNMALRTKGLTAQVLKDCISTAVASRHHIVPQPEFKLSQGRLAAAERLSFHLQKQGALPCR